MDCRSFKIFELVDPMNGETRYVGQTKTSLSHRLNGLIQQAKHGGTSDLAQWTWKLLDQQLRPQIVLIEETDDPYLYLHWIKYFKERGCDLLNSPPRKNQPILHWRHRGNFHTMK